MSRFAIVVLLLAGAGLAVSAYGSVAIQPQSPPSSTPSATGPTLSSGRTVMLLPDGRVEVTDAWARRVFRWDGKRWAELSVKPVTRPSD
jgi:hypothetical protein